jgi:hypothetical protein
MTLRKFLLIPNWLLTLAIKKRLPSDHPWKNKKCTLDWWNRGATDFAMQFGLVVWVGFVCMVIVIAQVILFR